MNKVILIVIIPLLISCSERNPSSYNLSKSKVRYTSVEKYLEKKESIISNNNLVKFVFLNNPYDLNNRNLVSISINDYLVYIGEFKKHIELKGTPDEIFDKNSRMIIVMEILTEKGKKNIWLHRFQSKTVFGWNKDYKIIYCGFFPTNEDVEKVYFIPQLEPII